MIKYSEYIVSPEWHAIRELRFQKDNYTCQKCGAKNELRGHHLTYERLGHEDIGDIITWCARCHNDDHYFDRPEATREMVIAATPITEAETERYKERYG
jgi:5-methylcytosine-specific restriction endonuclease McrA|tara:strand:+ start:1621 stop:1917 length:297 start_codon:yes stop_codon:yes gene_type:complete